MRYPVLVRSQDEKFVAEPLGIPELRTMAASEEEAIEQVEEALARWMKSAKLVEVTLPGRPNPWLEGFGRSADDPDFEEFVEELRRIRSADGGE